MAANPHVCRDTGMKLSTPPIPKGIKRVATGILAMLLLETRTETPILPKPSFS